MKKTKPLANRAAKRMNNNYTGTVLKVSPNYNQNNSPNNAVGSCSNSGSQYGGKNTTISPNKKYLAMVVQRVHGGWGYVRTNTHCLDVTSEPILYLEEYGNELIELWKRVVIDNAIPWEDSVRYETLRIVKYSSNIEDKTLELLGDFDQANEIIRRSAVSKLTAMESKLLGLDFHKTKQIMMSNSEFDISAKQTLNTLSKTSAHLTLELQLKDLIN
jgi:hypothetical protein